MKNLSLLILLLPLITVSAMDDWVVFCRRLHLKCPVWNIKWRSHVVKKPPKIYHVGHHDLPERTSSTYKGLILSKIPFLKNALKKHRLNRNQKRQPKATLNL
ncbi:uncharacterized protein LOC130622194 [Hydractinia symbiolongicarpus]|uniref:uncharacterized protein LOC130622194 n=1 Tax=Hydractinia symbiolongicarpus TaxID=13093 RepID=UPI00254EAACE|nr:uncharacterized protein LOC130622194 [Hydractinia symbiolongicarpus]